MTHTSSPTARSRRIVWISIASGIFALFIIAGSFYLAGGRWYVIQTPSMAEYAPVGTLVLSTMAGLGGLRKGQTILFHPPGSKEVYFHRILSISNGDIRTKGDLNSAVDPWTLHHANLLGTEVARIVGIGWLIQALPILLIGGLILHVVTRYYVYRYWRFPVRVLGWSVLVSLAAFLLKPFVRAVLLTQTVAHGRAFSTLVPTGLLDLHAEAVSGSSAVLRPGQAGSVMSDHAAHSGLFEVDLSPALGLGAWLILILIWLVPVILCVLYAIRHPQPDPV
jgi:hypothetical protein